MKTATDKPLLPLIFCALAAAFVYAWLLSAFFNALNAPLGLAWFGDAVLAALLCRQIARQNRLNVRIWTLCGLLWSAFALGFAAAGVFLKRLHDDDALSRWNHNARVAVWWGLAFWAASIAIFTAVWLATGINPFSVLPAAQGQ